MVFTNDGGYSLTVRVPTHSFGEDSVTISIVTANGYPDSARVSTATDDISWTFDVPANQGGRVRVCVLAGLANLFSNCQTFTIGTGTHYSVTLPGPNAIG